MFGLILWAVIVILIIVWATRIETGLNKLNATAERIEKQLADKKKEKR